MVGNDGHKFFVTPLLEGWRLAPLHLNLVTGDKLGFP